MLLVQAIYDKDQIQLKHIQLDCKYRFCKVFAFQSTSLKRAVHFYVFSDMTLEAFSVQVDVKEFMIVKIHQIGDAIKNLAQKDHRYYNLCYHLCDLEADQADKSLVSAMDV